MCNSFWSYEAFAIPEGLLPNCRSFRLEDKDVVLEQKCSSSRLCGHHWIITFSGTNIDEDKMMRWSVGERILRENLICETIIQRYQRERLLACIQTSWWCNFEATGVIQWTYASYFIRISPITFTSWIYGEEADYLNAQTSWGVSENQLPRWR